MAACVAARWPRSRGERRTRATQAQLVASSSLLDLGFGCKSRGKSKRRIAEANAQVEAELAHTRLCARGCSLVRSSPSARSISPSELSWLANSEQRTSNADFTGQTRRCFVVATTATSDNNAPVLCHLHRTEPSTHLICTLNHENPPPNIVTSLHFHHKNCTKHNPLVHCI